MKIGFVGLGKMGGNMARRLRQNGFPVSGFDTSADVRESLKAEGVETVSELADLLVTFSKDEKRAVWIMVPAGEPVDHVLEMLGPELRPGDIIIEGGNSRFSDTVRRAKVLREKGVELLDVGTSGGIGGLVHGYCLMIGGDIQAVKYLDPIFKALATKDGYLHVGANGSGHYAKMVHNGIEYAVMQAIGEGFDLLAHSPYEYNLSTLAGLWNRGSVLRSWLLELLQSALNEDSNLKGIAGYVEDSGEGRWTVEESILRSVPTPTIALALYGRFRSRREDSFTDKVVAALRKQFGGHAVKQKKN